MKWKRFVLAFVTAGVLVGASVVSKFFPGIRKQIFLTDSVYETPTSETLETLSLTKDHNF